MTNLEVPPSESAMSKIENGKQKVNVEELFAFAYVLEMSSRSS